MFLFKYGFSANEACQHIADSCWANFRKNVSNLIFSHMLVIYSLVKLCYVYITHAERGRCYPGYYSPIVPRQYKKSYHVHMIEIAWLPLGSTLGDDDPMSNIHSPFFTLLLFFASSPLTLTAAIICCLVLVNVRGTLRQLQNRAAKLVFSIGLQALFDWLSGLIQQLYTGYQSNCISFSNYYRMCLSLNKV